MKSDIFATELSYIKDEKLREMVREYFDTACPEYFFSVPASSTGKFHPAISQGEGGLVRHTKMAVRIAHDMLELEMWSGLQGLKDEIITAILIHDTCKLGDYTQEKYTRHDHPILASNRWREFCRLYDSNSIITDAIAGMVSSHMGQWNTNTHSDVELPKPKLPSEKFVHLCDWIASRNYMGKLEDM